MDLAAILDLVAILDFDGHLGFLVVISDMVEMFHLAAILVWTTLVNFGFVGLIRFTEIFDLSAILALVAILDMAAILELLAMVTYLI